MLDSKRPEPWPKSDRRPGIEKICERIARRNPKWSRERVMTEAKLQYHKARDNKRLVLK